MPLAALPLQIHDVLGFGNLTVGITIGLQALVTLLTRQFAGGLCDRRGAKFGVMLGSGVSILASAIYLASAATSLGPAASLALLLAARVISGLAESLVMTGALAWGIGAVGAKNTGKVMVWVGIGLYTAIAAGAPIGIELMKLQSVSRRLRGGFARHDRDFRSRHRHHGFHSGGRTAWRRALAVYAGDRPDRAIRRRSGAGDAGIRRDRRLRRARLSGQRLARRRIRADRLTARPMC